MVRLVVDRQIEIREVDQHRLERAMLARKSVEPVCHSRTESGRAVYCR